MTVHQCPECSLVFRYRPVLMTHLREEHPGFRVEYLAAHEEPSHLWPFERDDFATAEAPPRPRKASAAETGPPAPESSPDPV